MSDLLRIGATGINAYQNALTVTGNNITKANVEGYSRQEVTLAAQTAQQLGAGYIGTGVINDGVRRISDDFLVGQLRQDTSAFHNLDSYLSNIEQIDSLLANPSTGLTAGIENFFKAVESGAQNPSSIPARQSVLSEAEGMIERFSTLGDRLNDQNDIINQQLGTLAKQISALATGIAAINNAIAKAGGSSLGDQPNDLLDQRDEKLKELAKLVSVTVTEQNGGLINVFIGNGQALVIGTSANELVAQEGVTDPFRFDLGFVQGVTFQTVSQDLNGGELGGVLNFRSNVLDRTFNEIGRIALAMTEEINKLQNIGIDLEGNFGTDFFVDINTPEVMADRVVGSRDNVLPDDRVVTVEILDTREITTSDYILEMKAGAAFTITRMSDDTEVFRGVSSGFFPLNVELDGLSIVLESGSFQTGDKFLIQPTRQAALNIEMAITRTQEIAFAFPISMDASLGNVGNGLISQGEMLSIHQTDGTTLLDTFAVPGQLSPPMIIRFTSSTSYDVFDNTDPANPVDLQPPMRSRVYFPGLVNEVFSRDPNQTRVTSDTAINDTVVAGVPNGFPLETLTITTIDPDSGIPTSQTATLLANATAKQAAETIGQLDGVAAFADTSMVLQVTDVAAGVMTVTLNGVDLTDPTLGLVPVPITVDFIRDRINDSGVLALDGIVATSDGVNLTVRSTTGEDLSFAVTGGGVGDQLDISQANGQPALGGAVTTVAVGDTATIGGVVAVDMADSGYMNSSIAADAGRFSSISLAQNTYKGFQVALTGTPAVGDEFSIGFNTDGISDNRNGVALAALAKASTIQNSGISFQEAYGQLVGFIGTDTAQTRINQEASEALLRQSQANRDSLSGVNLDEEAARLIQFEQAYNASAQVVNIARQIFDSLLNAVR